MKGKNRNATPKIVEEDKELERSIDSVPQDEALPSQIYHETYSNNMSNNSPEYRHTLKPASEMPRLKRRKQSTLKSEQQQAVVASNTIIVAKSPAGYNIYTSLEQTQKGVPFNCREWAGKPKYGDTVAKLKKKTKDGVYVGHWQKGKDVIQGTGTMEYNRSGDFYEGWWLLGKREGMGKMTYMNPAGQIFYGVWSADEKVSGMQRYADGAVYTG